MTMLDTTKMSSRGQIVIPLEMRKDIKEGDKLIVIGQDREWFNVRLENGKQGWISNRVVK